MGMSDKILTYAIVGTVAYILITKPKVSVLGLPVFSVTDQNQQVNSSPSSSIVSNNVTPGQSVVGNLAFGWLQGLDTIAKGIAGWLVQ